MIGKAILEKTLVLVVEELIHHQHLAHHKEYQQLVE
jgi:hypothetical protein